MVISDHFFPLKEVTFFNDKGSSTSIL